MPQKENLSRPQRRAAQLDYALPKEGLEISLLPSSTMVPLNMHVMKITASM